MNPEQFVQLLQVLKGIAASLSIIGIMLFWLLFLLLFKRMH